jgi:hypothetical protein
MGGVWYSLHLLAYFWLAASVFKKEKHWQALRNGVCGLVF